MSYLGQPIEGFATRFPYGVIKNPVKAGGATDVLPVADADVFVTRAGINAMTLALPKAGVYPAGADKLHSPGDPGDDGKMLRVMATTAFAHTITTPANGINGSLHILTWTAAVGNFIVLIAYNGSWWAFDKLGVAIT